MYTQSTDKVMLCSDGTMNYVGEHYCVMCCIYLRVVYLLLMFSYVYVQTVW